MKSNRIHEKGRTSLQIIAYIVTYTSILLLLIPFVWMFSSSMKDSFSIRSYPPNWLPKQPQTVTIYYAYDQELGAKQDYELEAMKATWYAWKKMRQAEIGEIVVYGIFKGETAYKSTTRAYQFRVGEIEVIAAQQFTEANMARKLPIIQQRGYSKFVWYGEDGAGTQAEKTDGGSKSDIAVSIEQFLQEADFMHGELIGVSQHGDWKRVADQYIALWMRSSSSFSFHLYMMNSFIVTGGSIVLQLLVGGLAGYALSRLISERWSKRLLLYFVATIMIPEMAILVPLYLTIEKLGLVNTLWGIILPHSAWGIVIFLFKGFFDQLSGELLQAARIDGAKEWRVFRSIVVPMSIPIFTIVAVMSFVAVWNELLWPMVVARQEAAWTFTVALNELQMRPGIELNMLMASMVISTIPLLIIFMTCQRLIEKAVSWTGVKG